MAEGVADKTLLEISKKLNVLIALSVRQLLNDKEFTRGKRKGVGELVHYLATCSSMPRILRI